MGRRFPNILISGTPGTGKTTLCEQLVELFPSDSNNTEGLGFTHIKVGELINNNQLYTEWDDELNVPILDDDLLLTHLQSTLENEKGGNLIDFHSGEVFPPEWFDLVIVLRTETHVLFDRLKQRGFSERKIKENVEAEIFQTILEDIKSEFDGKVELWVVSHNTIDEQNQILERINKWFIINHTKTN